MEMHFEEFGFLEWLEPTDYFEGDWSYKGSAEGADEEEYAIVFSRSRQEFRYTII